MTPTPEPSASPTPEPPQTPVDEDVVSIYADCEFAGTASNLSLGEFSAGGLSLLGFDNNTISSIKVPYGYKVQLYNNQFRGTSVTLESDVPCLAEVDFDNMTSSAVVEIDEGLIDLAEAKSAYDAQCSGCHGSTGNGLIPIIPSACTDTDCSDVTELAQYISDFMPKGDVAACVLTEASPTQSCAAQTAAYIAAGFVSGVNPEPMPPVVTAKPFARLTNEEFVASALALLSLEMDADIEEAREALGAESNIHGLLSDASTQLLTQVGVSGYVGMVDTLVDSYFAGIDSAEAMADKLECTVALQPCTEQRIASLAERAFRRTLEDTDIAAIEALYTSVDAYAEEASIGADAASVERNQIRFRAAMHYILLSPDFLLMIEEGGETSDTAGNTYLSAHEVATRMAYFLTGTLPDEALLAAAEDGTLLDAAVRAQHAERILSSDAGEGQIVDILASWFGINPAVVDAESLSLLITFLEDWVANNKAFSELYQANVEVLHQSGSRSMEPFGILGLNAFVASHTEFPTPSFITRGVFFVERLLCEKLPDDIPADALDSVGLTPVEVFEVHAQDPCASCHRVFDNYGAVFQQFDPELSLFNPESKVFGDHFDLFDIGDVSAEVSDVADLGMEMGLSTEAPACMTTLWYRHALRRNTHEGDSAVLEQLLSEWQASGDMGIKSLLQSIVASDAFVTF